MSHLTFGQIKGTEIILVNYISRLRCMGLYGTLDSQEDGKKFGYFMFEELLPHFNGNCKSNKRHAH